MARTWSAQSNHHCLEESLLMLTAFAARNIAYLSIWCHRESKYQQKRYPKAELSSFSAQRCFRLRVHGDLCCWCTPEASRNHSLAVDFVLESKNFCASQVLPEQDCTVRFSQLNNSSCSPHAPGRKTTSQLSPAELRLQREQLLPWWELLSDSQFCLSHTTTTLLTAGFCQWCQWEEWSACL